ncbi:hypothetical protein [Hymenobacter cellulosilyticus]|uniref:Uncharacterized protein n=1 Tax=Hymenobacter cellulosilyticus TaxID=2932248 RepID=A0A8T9Q5V2_9BACT|nr:hypothetical protein [Hymenobacter cellulosilyticus]UOQ72907.1 hypothetical protein MUN79_02660 [Hymenobacter cellulosilyticus]
MRHVWIIAGLVLGISTAAAAQTEDMYPARKRAENRRALRDARKFKAEYKDSHLAVEKTDLKPGAAAKPQQPNDGRESYKFDNAGVPRVSEPAHIGLGLRKKKKATKD